MHAVALLVTEIVERAERFDAEHQFIADLHRRLFTPIPQMDGLVATARYLPSGRSDAIGGDWYEGVVLGDDRLAVVVGDVVGHGLAAAADMALVRGIITALLHDGVEVKDVLVRVSGLLQRRPDLVHATAALVVVDAAAGTLTYTTAGHPPPLLLAPDGSVTRLDEANTPMLGVEGGHPIAQTIPVRPGSRLLMYTDGLVERRDRSFADGVSLAEHELVAHGTDVSGDACIDGLLATLVGTHTGLDDIAIVVLDIGADAQ
jgi:serine phosphatase RsbU (regulator of sigma subunit)